MKLSQMKTLDQVVEEHGQSPEFVAEWDRAAFAREVATAVVRYRAEHGLTQRQLAAATGITQPAIARLELGETAPSLGTLVKLTKSTNLRFHVDIADGGAELADDEHGPVIW
jgi:DNA-binding XRE family transcriptional regulator